MAAKKKRSISVFVLIILVTTGLQLQGCEFKIVPEEENKREIPFVIISEECVPKELGDFIEQKKEKEMKLTYVDEEERYIIIGYGKQNTGGYSIYIKDLYATDNAIYVDSCLLGPKEKSEIKNIPSYPVIVLQISEMGLPVVFK